MTNKRNNDLNVFTYGYLPMKYPRNWWSNIKQFFRNIKYAWQRATRGYSEFDIWNLDLYYSKLFAATLNALADMTHSYPGVGEADAYEKWVAMLKEAAKDWKLSYDTDSLDITVNRVEYEMFDLMMAEVSESKFVPDANNNNWLVRQEKYKDPQKYEEYHQLWRNACDSAEAFREEHRKKGEAFIQQYWGDLWD